MSSLTSLSVNKNNRSFAPKLKSRPRKAAQQQQQEKQQQQEQAAAAAAEKEVESSESHDQPTQKDNNFLQVPAQRHESASQEDMSPLETLAAVASNASREREAPEVAATPRAPTPQPQSPRSVTESSSSTKETATTKSKTTERSKDKGKQRKGRTSKKSSSTSTSKATPISTPISIPTPGQSSSENTRDSPAASQAEGESDEAAAEARRARGRKRNRDYDPQELQTLDDIQHDPAPKDYLDRPMADFVKDLQTGIVSKTFKEYEIERLKKKRQLEEQSKMSAEERATAQAQEKMEERIRELAEEARRKEQEELRRKKEEEENVLQETANAPQVRLVNGQIVLDVDSLTVERQNEYEEMDTSAMEVVEESTMSRKVNSRTHGRQIQSARWTAVETEMFYNAIAMFGTDFEMVKYVLPNRTRNQIRHKFNREEKQNPEKIKDYLIRRRKPVDLDMVKELSGKEFDEVPDEFSEPISAVNEG